MKEVIFKNWLNQNKGGARRYPTAIYGISKHYSENTGQITDIYDITDLNKIAEIEHEYSSTGKFSEKGSQQGCRFRTAISYYADFFTQFREILEKTDNFDEHLDYFDDMFNSEIAMEIKSEKSVTVTYQKDLQTALFLQISDFFSGI